ncbi:MAG: hypothetical protein GY699_14310, partial [Desulfobacteraceae bacterium]|nr:hypothetical protein [Desulfobacteraceae bacterium]
GPDGITYEYTYTEDNKISGITIPGQGGVTYTEYGWARPETILLPGGTQRTFSYDAFDRPKTIETIAPGGDILIHSQYEYDNVGNITSHSTTAGSATYGYDGQYRLTSVQDPLSGDVTYQYDSNGNRISKSDLAGLWNYDGNDQLIDYGDTSFAYDSNGNTTSEIKNSEEFIYIYDHDNRLIRIENHTGGTIAEYYYDPFGRRLWKETGGERTYYFYSDEGLIGEYNSSGTQIKSYGYEPGSIATSQPIFLKTDVGYYYYQNNHLNAPVKITDTNGTIVWSAQYDTFGKADVLSGSVITNNLRFPGQYEDSETGLHYNFNRYYNPETGRFLSSDPIGLNGGLNRYSYANMNPINLIDPYGLCSFDYYLEGAGNFLVAFGRTIDPGIADLINRGMDRWVWGNEGKSTNDYINKDDPGYSAGRAAGYIYNTIQFVRTGAVIAWKKGLNAGSKTITWTGKRAKKFAEYGGIPMHKTPIGAVLDKTQNVLTKFVGRDKANKLMFRINARASATYVKNAKGPVRRVVDTLDKEASGKFYRWIEKPILDRKKNKIIERVLKK